MTKDHVLAILKNAETYVSGEKISNQLGITRSAVNLAVKNLRQEGYQISSSTNKGYLLETNKELDLLTVGELLAILPKSEWRLLYALTLPIPQTMTYEKWHLMVPHLELL